MKKALIATLHRPDRSPSQRFRFEQYLGYLQENGVDCNFSYLVEKEDDGRLYKKGKYFTKLALLGKFLRKRWKDTLSIDKYDVVFVQREAFIMGFTFLEKKAAKSKAKFIFDFDDSIWLQNVSDANKNLVFLKDFKKTEKLIAQADLVVAGNEYLSDYAKQFNPNVTIVPTTIDTEEYKPDYSQKNSDTVCIGWSGSVTTIQHFEHALSTYQKIKDKYGDKVKFKVIGDGNYRNESLDIQGIAWSKDGEVPELNEMDIGLMPLPNDEWAKGKCGLKGLQYMALEIPTIMSPVGVNTEIIQHGENGFLAESEDEWFEVLCQLIDDADLRKTVGKAGRKTVAEKYSVEAWKDRYLEIFKT